MNRRDTLMELPLACRHDGAMTANRTTGFTDIDRQHWSLRYLPPAARPFGRLARWDRPIGTWLLLFPCWWSLALAVGRDWAQLLGWMVLFALGALAMRGAGCTWNDILDRKIDAEVERTRSRPLPAGEASLRGAVVWMGLQALVGAVILFKFNKFAVLVGLASLAIVAIYPLMKRVTSWPQVVLGFAFNWGALLGFAAVTEKLSWATVALYFGGVAWTMVYDTIYAMQDQRDDAIVGVRSTARRFADAPRCWLTLFAAVAVALWVGAGLLAPLHMPYFIVLAGVAAHFGWQIVDLKPHDQPDCLGKFKANAQVGWLMLAAIVAGQFG
jgi:4-hydroxybenzoate polyprenyltransferase